MAKYRKLSRTSDQRKALLRNQVTNLLYHGKIVTTEAKAKEIRKIAESLIAMAVREKDNFEKSLKMLRPDCTLVVRWQKFSILLKKYLQKVLAERKIPKTSI